MTFRIHVMGLVRSGNSFGKAQNQNGVQVNRVVQQARQKEIRVRTKIDPNYRLPKLPPSTLRYRASKSKAQKSKEARSRYRGVLKMWNAGLPTGFQQMRAYLSRLLRCSSSPAHTSNFHL